MEGANHPDNANTVPIPCSGLNTRVHLHSATTWPSCNMLNSALHVCIFFVFNNADASMSIAKSVSLHFILFGLIPQQQLLLSLSYFDVEDSPQHIGQDVKSNNQSQESIPESEACWKNKVICCFAY